MAEPTAQYIKHIAACGETFDLLALHYYHEEKLAHHIIQENTAYNDVLIFIGGEELYISVLTQEETPSSLPPWRR